MPTKAAASALAVPSAWTACFASAAIGSIGRAPPRGWGRDEKTFELEVQTLGNDDVGIATLTFDGTSVSGRVATLGSWVTLKGEADWKRGEPPSHVLLPPGGGGAPTTRR